ncbi:MAG TPA: hypothetical protein PKO06_24235, partial [Candidatus Ozemobacteraceae bacterium]|nr:hypothetical protein [Candidatus Ozemobacteraceae bacterium]
MPHQCLVLILLICAVTCCPLAAWERDVDLRDGTRLYKGAAIYGWHQKLLGDIDVLGLKVDLSGDAAFDDRVGMGASFFLPVTRRTTLLGGYDEFDHSGKVTKTVNFRRKQYRPGARIDLQHEWLDLTGASRVRQWEGGFGDFLYGMKVCRSELNLRGNDPITNAFQKAAWDTMFPIPYLGFGGGARVTSHMLILGRFKAIVLPSTGEDLFTSYDAELTG